MNNLRVLWMITIKTNCEFASELICVIPYAYWLHKNNKLEKTNLQISVLWQLDQYKYKLIHIKEKPKGKKKSRVGFRCTNDERFIYFSLSLFDDIQRRKTHEHKKPEKINYKKII